jgi:hypothetical protein
MLVMTGWAMKINLVNFYHQNNWLLIAVGSIVVALEIWMVVESAVLLVKNKGISEVN